MGFAEDHPNGNSLLARDTPENRKLFPDGPFGYEDVADSICDGDKCPHYQYTNDATDEGAKETPIHMLVAAFRDKLCSRTIHNAFTRAANPSRIFIRIVDQTQPDSDLVDDQGCWPRYCAEYNNNCDEFKDQVQIAAVDSKLSQGPTWARSKLSAMVHWDYAHRNEPDQVELKPIQIQDFCMQIDSHMDFSDNFDTGLVKMFHRTQNDYAVLSTYVTDIEKNNQDVKTVPNLCMVTFTSSIRNWGTKECRGLVKPKLTNAMWGAGLSFHRCHAELNVPVDPYLDNVFDGEEGSRGIRFFTHGYDVYAPDKVLVTHDYHGHQSNAVVHTWGHGGRKQVTDTTVQHTDWKWMADIDAARPQWTTFGSPRVNMLLGIGSAHNSTKEEANEVEMIRKSRFGVGTKRSMEQVRTFTGIDLLNRRMESNKCGNLIWVPYEESDYYGVDEVLSRGYANEVVASPPHSELAQPLVAPSRGVLRGRTLEDTVAQGMDHQLALCLLGAVILLIARVSTGSLRGKDERHKA